ncbi:unnamed protein product [Ambrosiozyma monospora]|uniref:Unnamed protein product n=1 Tax=Ambrosiozyma monospora TaxID=43982 RepID=A0ACB5TAD7_AMBMO|nr:unnamed protein product [Ambrosiozyma monospora]
MLNKLLPYIPLITLITQADALASPEPLAFAYAEGLPIAAEASYDCHADCGYAILAARQCSPDGKSDSDYDEECLCTSNEQFSTLVPECLECGWCLWTDYGKYLTSALSLCSYQVTPTGTECASESANYLASAGVAAVSSDSSKQSAASYYASQYGASSSSVSVAEDKESSSSGSFSSSKTITSYASSSKAAGSNSDSSDTTSGSSGSSAPSEGSSSSSVSTGGGAQYIVGIGSILLAFCAMLV